MVTVVPVSYTHLWGSLEAQGGYSMHSGGMLSGWKFSNFKDGVFAEYFHVNEADANLARLPEGLDPAAAVMLSDMVPTGFQDVYKRQNREKPPQLPARTRFYTLSTQFSTRLC